MWGSQLMAPTGPSQLACVTPAPGFLCMARRGGGTRDVFEPDTVTLWPHSQLTWNPSSNLGCVLLRSPLVLGETTTHKWEAPGC